MATRGRNICNTLKAIRKQIADANGIDYSPEECHFKGECRGTCPKCEQDASDLEYELRLRAMAGKAIKVAGIAAGLVAMTACSDGKPQRGIPGTNTGEAVLVEEDSTDISNLSGKVDGTRPVKRYTTTKFAPPEENMKDGEVPNADTSTKVIRQRISKDKAKSTPPKDSRRHEAVATEPVTDNDSTNSHRLAGVIEEMPVFPGGHEALMKYIVDNLRSPEGIEEGTVTGRVIVGFTVNEDGSISDVKVMRGDTPALNKEAVRVVESMPKWTPGKVMGKVAKAKYVLPINFHWQ